MPDCLGPPACVQFRDRLSRQIRGQPWIGATASRGPVRERGRAGGQPGGRAVQLRATAHADVAIDGRADQRMRKHAAAPASRVQLQQPLRARFLQGRQRVSETCQRGDVRESWRPRRGSPPPRPVALSRAHSRLAATARASPATAGRAAPTQEPAARQRASRAAVPSHAKGMPAACSRSCSAARCDSRPAPASSDRSATFPASRAARSIRVPRSSTSSEQARRKPGKILRPGDNDAQAVVGVHPADREAQRPEG